MNDDKWLEDMIEWYLATGPYDIDENSELTYQVIYEIELEV